MSSEAQARITINKLLEAAEWRFAPDDQGRPANIVCEHRVTKKKLTASHDWGKDYEHAPNGFIDYLLLNTDQRPVAVLEAKRESIDPLSGKEQARAYAETQGVAHIFLSNGLVHYYWNLRQGNPIKVSRLLPLEQLGKAAEWKPDSARLATVTVDENYIAVSQDAAWLSYSAAERANVMVNKNIRLLRDYQVEAIHALQQAAPGGQRFLFEMATGTGKTLLSAAIAKLYLRSANADRVLFLVDRLELETQAWRNFQAYLANDAIETVIYKQKRQEWMNAQVVVTTIQSLAAKNRYQEKFAPTDFQLIISDEAHRTISGNNRAIFEYFVGAKLGLTATPRDYLKGLKKDAQQKDPRNFEERLLLDTYRTFGCDDGTPTFRYSLMNAVRHKPPYLCNPITLDARTDITTRMLSDEGYAVNIGTDEDGQETELTFKKSDYERKFFSDETNTSFIRCFLDNAECDLITGETGKTIMFAVSRRHATKLVTLLNEEATRRWPREYGAGSTFAVQVTSDIAGAQQNALDFANNNLNGKSKWRKDAFRDYNTSRTRVCVTVGMMTTGYDCEDVLNVVLARPIFSPTDFIQIKGRGTRLFKFEHEEKAVNKDKFALFDFFANCEFFETKFDYDKKLALPPTSAGGGGEPPPPSGEATNTSPDPMAQVKREAIGLSGMRVDREMYCERFAKQAEEAAQADEALRVAIESENWPAVEAQARRLLFDKPKEFWNLAKVQAVYKSDRLPSLREIMQRVYGYIPEIPTRGQLADEAFERFVSTEETAATLTRELRTVFVSFLLDPTSRELLKDGRFAELRARDASLYGSLTQLDKTGRERLMSYLNSQVPLKEFVQA